MSRRLKPLAGGITAVEANIAADIAPLEQRPKRPVLERHKLLRKPLCDGQQACYLLQQFQGQTPTPIAAPPSHQTQVVTCQGH